MEKSEGRRFWNRLFGVIPVGARVKFRDKRFAVGYFVGRIVGYYQTKRLLDRDEVFPGKYFGYRVVVERSGPFRWTMDFPMTKDPKSIMEVLPTRRR